MPNKNIFCNVPWYQGHVYWDGTFGYCCVIHTADGHGYNVKSNTAKEWLQSHELKEFKQKLLGDEKLSPCDLCYREEDQGFISKRQNENLKSAIWPSEFDRSFNESYTRDKFLNIDPSTYKEWHLDSGNECNLACKMCNPYASSKIETMYKKWGMPTADTSKTLWMNHPNAKNFVKEICDNEQLKRVHIMGGEPLIQPNFKYILKQVSESRPDISFSFVSNSTKYDSDIARYLEKFASVDIELSLETVDSVNDYIRQGCQIENVLDVIDKWHQHKSEKFGIVIRPTPSILSVSRYVNLLQWAHDNKHIIRSVLLTDPYYLRISLLPEKYRAPIIKELTEWSNNIKVSTNEYVGTRDQHRWEASLKQECDSMITCLQQPVIPGAEKDLIAWLQRWDNEYKLNVVDYLPEFSDFFTEHGYTISN